MRFWVYIDHAMAGPFEPAELKTLPGFSLQSKVCEDGEMEWCEASNFSTIRFYYVSEALANSPAAPAVEPRPVAPAPRTPQPIPYRRVESIPSRSAPASDSAKVAQPAPAKSETGGFKVFFKSASKYWNRKLLAGSLWLVFGVLCYPLPESFRNISESLEYGPMEAGPSPALHLRHLRRQPHSRRALADALRSKAWIQAASHPLKPAVRSYVTEEEVVNMPGGDAMKIRTVVTEKDGVKTWRTERYLRTGRRGRFEPL